MQSTLWDRPTFVYLAFDAEREFLYTGISADWRERLSGHRYASPWYQDATWFMLKLYGNRLDAIAEESFLINHRDPIWNVLGQHGYCRCQHVPAVDYLDWFPNERELVRF